MNETRKQLEKLYSIGQASDLCDVSARTLRYYEEKGLVKPDLITESRYRYYNGKTLRTVQIIRYLIDEGFSLEEVKMLIINDDFDQFQRIFKEQMDKIQSKLNRYCNSMASLESWYDIISEGRDVLKYHDDSVKLRFIKGNRYFYVDFDIEEGDSNYQARCEVEYYSKSKKDGRSMTDVGGAFLWVYSSYEARMDGSIKKVRLQQRISPISEGEKDIAITDDFLAVCSYHIGPLNDVDKTYKKCIQWAKAHNVKLKGTAVERAVIDVYTSGDENRFVTEIILPIQSE